MLRYKLYMDDDLFKELLDKFKKDDKVTVSKDVVTIQYCGVEIPLPCASSYSLSYDDGQKRSLMRGLNIESISDFDKIIENINGFKQFNIDHPESYPAEYCIAL